MSTKRVLTILASSSILFLSGCGGGGGGGGGAPAPAPQPPPDANPGGIWVGTFTSDVLNVVEDVLGVVTETGELRFVAVNSGSQYFGNITVDGNDFDGSLRAVTLAGGTFPNGASSGTVNVNGSITSRNEISGDFVGVGDEGTFSMSYDPLYERDSSLANIAADWTADELIFKILLPSGGIGLIGVAVSAGGTLQGTDTNGCDYDGSIELIDSNFNIYDVAVVVTSCGALDGQYDGFAVVSDDTQTNDVVIIAMSTSQVSIVGELLKTPRESAAGIWNGFLQSPFFGTLEVLGVISEANDVQFIDFAGTQLAGLAEVFGNIARIDVTAFAPFGTLFPNGSNRGPVRVRALVNNRAQIQGVFAGVGDQGIFSIIFDSIYDRDSALGKIEGTWSTVLPGSIPLTIMISPNGEFQGMGSGCNYAGSISLIDSDFNAYDVAGDLTACGNLDGSYTGLGVLTDQTAPDDTLLIAGANVTTSLWAAFERQP